MDEGHWTFFAAEQKNGTEIMHIFTQEDHRSHAFKKMNGPKTQTNDRQAEAHLYRVTEERELKWTKKVTK